MCTFLVRWIGLKSEKFGPGVGLLALPMVGSPPPHCHAGWSAAGQGEKGRGKGCKKSLPFLMIELRLPTECVEVDRRRRSETEIISPKERVSPPHTQRHTLPPTIKYSLPYHFFISDRPFCNNNFFCIFGIRGTRILGPANTDDGA